MIWFTQSTSRLPRLMTCSLLLSVFLLIPGCRPRYVPNERLDRPEQLRKASEVLYREWKAKGPNTDPAYLFALFRNGESEPLLQALATFDHEDWRSKSSLASCVVSDPELQVEYGLKIKSYARDLLSSKDRWDVYRGIGLASSLADSEAIRRALAGESRSTPLDGRARIKAIYALSEIDYPVGAYEKEATAAALSSKLPYLTRDRGHAIGVLYRLHGRGIASIALQALNVTPPGTGDVIEAGLPDLLEDISAVDPAFAIDLLAKSRWRQNPVVSGLLNLPGAVDNQVEWYESLSQHDRFLANDLIKALPDRRFLPLLKGIFRLPQPPLPDFRPFYAFPSCYWDDELRQELTDLLDKPAWKEWKLDIAWVILVS